jgi:HEAT repeat protein
VTRRKPRLYAFAPEVELGWFTDVAPGSPDFAVLAAAVRAFADVCANRELTANQRLALEQAAVHPHPAVRGLGIMRLAVLSHYFPAAGEALTALASHPEEDVRMWAVGALANTPATVAVGALQHGLSDAAWPVRKAAAQVLAALPLPGTLPAIEAALAVERDARVRVVLALAAELQAREPVVDVPD